ncbi:MAG: hypothetical protein FWH05_09330 [Oscillospiraceae bacterium]|nr:hypothetical protein [Oscillospiraceae bacterium]
MLAEQNPQVEKAVVRLMELSADEKTRLVYESRHKMEWDNWARERAAMQEGVQKGILETARKMKMDNIPLDIIRKYTDLPAATIRAL